MVSHFHVFYCHVYVHVLDEKKNEFVSRDFVRYNETSKVENIYIMMQWCIVVSRDVKIDEDGWSSSFEEHPTEIVKGEKVIDLKFDLEDKSCSYINKEDPTSKGEVFLPSSSARKLRWLTQTLKEIEREEYMGLLFG